MSLKDQAQQMAKRCSTVSYYSSHHKAQSDSSGGDVELSPKERHVKESTAILICHTRFS